MVSSRFVNIGNLQLHVRDWGGETKPPLFLLHGLASSNHMFDLIAEPLNAHYRVYAVDQRGHALSDKPTNGYNFEAVACDLDQVADALGYVDQPITVIGHSWGAYTTLYYAATRPARTSKAVLIDGGIRAFRDLFPTWAEAEIGLAPPLYVNLKVADLNQYIRDWQGAGFRPETEALARTIFDVSDANNVHAHLSRENNMKIAYALWEFQPTDYYAQVRCPMLIINAVAPGKRVDPEIQRYAHEAETQASNAKVVWMHDTIHDIPWHRPQELSRILAEFL